MLLFEHGNGLTGVETEFMLEDSWGALPHAGLARNIERLSDMLDLIVIRIHHCPHSETLLPRSRIRSRDRDLRMVNKSRVSDLRDSGCIKNDTNRQQTAICF